MGLLSDGGVHSRLNQLLLTIQGVRLKLALESKSFADQAHISSKCTGSHSLRPMMAMSLRCLLLHPLYVLGP